MVAGCLGKWDRKKARIGAALEEQEVLRAKRPEQSRGEKQGNAFLEPCGCLFEAQNSIRETWEVERRRNVGTHWGKAMDILGLFLKGRRRDRRRKDTLRSTNHVPGSE